MRCCQPPAGYEDFFSEKQARRDARRFRRKGLDRSERWVADTLIGLGISGQTILEPGGGVGAIDIELLRAGAEHATVVELSPGYEQVAIELAREAAVGERLTRRVGDFAANGDEPADVVILHRVVCCYPEYESLLGAAAERARRTLVFTYPPRNWVSRALVAMTNLWLRWRGTEFRTFAHEPSRMIDVVVRQGFEPLARRRGGIWRGVAFARQTPS